MEILQYENTLNRNHLIDRLPEKPYCSNNLSEGLKIRTKPHAIKHSYIQHNKISEVQALVFDIDYGFRVDMFEDLGLPLPSIITQNKTSKEKAHVIYLLEQPVYTTKNSSVKALRYASVIEDTYATKLNSDLAYTGLITKNPMSSEWNVLEQNKLKVFSLGELADYIDIEEKKPKQKNKEIRSLGRNVEIFDRTRFWAYSWVNEYRACKTIENWIKAVEEQAKKYNTFIDPLQEKEVIQISKSIAKWTWLKFKGVMNDTDWESYVKNTHTSEIQAVRGKKGGIMKKGKIHKKTIERTNYIMERLNLCQQ